jgi:3,4-dihydroxy 2-butanone 4-phosphate synthase/GTP cyclohydrolase II
MICVSIDTQVAKRLNLPLQASDNASTFGTPFTLSVDHVSSADEGVSARARCHTMRELLNPESKPEDFICPGHVFPLVAHPNGVLGRKGQTEGSSDLAKLAGLPASGVICEILNPDGTVAKGRQIAEFSKRHGFKVTSVADIRNYRLATETGVRQSASREIELAGGKFRVYVFDDLADGKEHLALVYGDAAPVQDPPLVRLHSECLTGDVFGSRRCDCGLQLEESIKAIVSAGKGIILYLRQEGRGIGLGNKLRAYSLQDCGHDTVDANIMLGFRADSRSYAVAANMLKSLGVSTVDVLTNNPRKLQALEQHGIRVHARIPLQVPPDPESAKYLETKREKLGHLLYT